MSLYAFSMQTSKEAQEEAHRCFNQLLSFLRSAQRSGRWCLLKRKENWRCGKGRQGSLWKRNENLYSKKNWKQKRSSQISMYPRGLLWPSSCFVLSIAQKPKENILVYPLVMLQRNWERFGITLSQRTSSLMKTRLPSWRKNIKKDITGYWANGKPGAAKKWVIEAEKSKKKRKSRRMRKRKMKNMMVMNNWVLVGVFCFGLSII